MDSNYFVSLDKIVSCIRRALSSSSQRKRAQAWTNLTEELHLLENKYEKLIEVEKSLGSFDVEKGEPPTEAKYGDLCAELQYKLLDAVREFHIQVYTATASLMNFTKIAISDIYRRGICVSSVARFYDTVTSVAHLENEVEILKKSYNFRVCITHPEQSKNYNWMTSGSRIIYFENSEKGIELELKKSGKNLPPRISVKQESFEPPNTTETFVAFSKLTKSYLRKFKDDNNYTKRMIRSFKNFSNGGDGGN